MMVRWWVEVECEKEMVGFEVEGGDCSQHTDTHGYLTYLTVYGYSTRTSVRHRPSLLGAHNGGWLATLAT